MPRPIISEFGSAVARLALLLFSLVFSGGCDRGPPLAPPLPRSETVADRPVVMAQGQLLPAGGIIQLFVQPGDTVEQLSVAVGEHVRAGQSLAVMRSQAGREARQATVRQQLVEAQRAQANAVASAELQVKAAQLQLSQVDSKRATLDRQSDLLQLAEQQVTAVEAVLRQLERLSNDARTGEFVGRLEVDRQRLAVGEAQLDYRRQLEAQRQAIEELERARQVAAAELEAAELKLQAATASDGVKIIQLQLAALELEATASAVVAPEAGVILVINATPGEASPQKPLIEMANTEQLVCEAEVNEMDAAVVQPGQPAILHSRAFAHPLRGRVLRKSPLVGRPQLRPLDPLARVDYRAVTTLIQLDPESTEQARQWLQLQVEVEIQIE